MNRTIIRAWRIMFFIFIALSSAGRAHEADAASAQAAWTVMVFMNGKNNLEEDALDDFLELARIGSSDRVNILVEFGRPKENYTTRYGGWSGLRRYYVKAGDQPQEAAALMDVGHLTGIEDMGDPRSLRQFLS